MCIIPLGIKVLNMLRLGFSHVREHKFKQLCGHCKPITSMFFRNLILKPDELARKFFHADKNMIMTLISRY